MSNLPPLAITTCRVSTDEQLKSNSLQRQARSVEEAAKQLGAIIPQDGQWSGSVSSKAGSNVKRKDIREMLEYVKKNRRVKYLIVHKVDRFMRSIKELFYFEVKFELLGVKIWYAGEPELNTDDIEAKQKKAEKVFRAEASNAERQEKSIEGLEGALEEGRYPFQPPAGYRKGYRAGIPEIDGERGERLKENLLLLFALKDPTRALQALNANGFTQGRAKLKMDKYRRIVTNKFYAGYVHMNKQVKSGSIKGMHVPMISVEQHLEIVRIMDKKKKNQTGPNRNGNPTYPLSSFVTCVSCKDMPDGKLVGFTHSNGSINGPKYEKYRCRSCKRYISRSQLHTEVETYLGSLGFNDGFLETIESELLQVWKQEEDIAKNEIVILHRQIEQLELDTKLKAEAIIDPSNQPIKSVLLDKVSENQQRVRDLGEQVLSQKTLLEDDRISFIQFAMSYVRNTSEIFLSGEYDKHTRGECKQLLFPSGFFLTAKNKVYTPVLSPIYTLNQNKMDTDVSKKSSMVRVQGL